MVENPYESFCPDAVVLAAGDFPRHVLPLSLLRMAGRVVCCDSAADNFVEHFGSLPWKVVGDGDSISAALRERLGESMLTVAEQETNDMTKATLYAESQGLRRIAYVGATGKREDHTLGNVALLVEYLRRGLEVRMYTDHGVFVPCDGQCRFSVPIGTEVSIFSFGARHLQADGLRYPLYDFTAWWQGTLNETVSDVFSVRADGVFMVYACYPGGE